MSLIRFRILFLITIALSVVGGFGYLAVTSFSQYARIHQDLNTSFYLQDKTEALDVWKFSKSTLEDLKNSRRALNQEHRAEALSDVIQAYANRNPTTLRKKVDHFVRNELEFRKYLFPLVAYLEKRIEYFSLISLTAMILSLLVVYLYIRTSLFKEISTLSRKMVDFLNQRYTYQFTVPSPNEMGHLQATFNSLAQKVLSQMEELKSLDRAKSDFLSIASHELRTPLTSIKGSLSLLKTGVVGQMNEACSNLVNIAEQETDRLIRLINDLLDLAKIEARKLPLTKQWSPIRELVKPSLDGIQGLARTAGVRLVSSDVPSVEAHMDKDRIQQILTNLISNAIKYSPKNGTVRLSIEIDESDRLVFSVTDEGKGIAPEDQELIFQKFRQATNAENPLVKGTGLGLAIAKALVEEHRGVIGVHSQPGSGSTFYFTLGEWRFSVEEEQQLDPPNQTGVAA
ncbi:MAG: HAMP domain-containing histidine kinase [Bdellovibrionaceae bacterium]|nr:HAMP domain-containing histidine kinase [Bdellovibrionales bacterium]MCB9084517.1 HAMP domain-containing histidine kinase [Pseudobdellovibrionaceae bacterium]